MADPKDVPILAPDGKIRMVPAADVDKLIAAGGQRAVKMNDPSGKPRWVPESHVEDLKRAGGKVAEETPPQESNAVQKAYDKFIAPIAPNEHAGAVLDAIQNFARHAGMAAHPLFHPKDDAAAMAHSVWDENPVKVAQKLRDGYRQNGVVGVDDAYKEVLNNSMLGRLIGGVKKDYEENGPVQGTASLLGDVAGAYLGGEATKGVTAAAAPVVRAGAKSVASTGADAIASTRDAFKAARAKVYPRNMSLTPEEAATQSLVKGTVPELAAVQRIKGAASELPDALAYAERTGQPINGKLDTAKALRGRAAEIQTHYTEKLMRPHSGKFKTVPEEYNGEMSGNGKNQATIGQINDRVDAINRELKSNFRKKLKSQTTEANASDADLNAEKGKLTKILHESLADMNGLQPEDIASVRQRAGKLRSLAEETELSADRDTVSAGRSAMGASGVPAPTKTGILQNGYEFFKGGPEVIGNRNFQGSLKGFEAKEAPLPQPVLPDPATTATTPEAARAEFLRAHELEQGSQDAAAARNAEAERLRTQNVDTQKGIAQTEATRAITSEQAAQDAAAARNTEAEKLRTQNVDAQKGLAQSEVVRDVEGTQTAQDLAAARAKFAEARRRANVNQETAAQREAAQAEVLKAKSLEDAAQDAAAQRAKVANEAREGNAAASYQARTGRPHPTKTDSIDELLSQPTPTARQTSPPIALPAPEPAPNALPDPPEVAPVPNSTIEDKEIVPADAERGVKPITLPVVVPAEGSPTPATHVFSKSAAEAAAPGSDVEAAAAAAAKAGYEVQE